MQRLNPQGHIPEIDRYYMRLLILLFNLTNFINQNMFRNGSNVEHGYRLSRNEDSLDQVHKNEKMFRSESLNHHVNNPENGNDYRRFYRQQLDEEMRVRQREK